MQSGPLDRRIVIERAALTSNAFGEGVPTWGALAEVWAHKQDVSDKERQQSAEVAAEITTRFKIRWSPDVATVNPKDRVVFDGRVYNLSAVKEIGRREGLELSATARVD
jgi:SPP1 family predicted phage head-tail adaptor